MSNLVSVIMSMSMFSVAILLMYQFLSIFFLRISLRFFELITESLSGYIIKIANVRYLILLPQMCLNHFYLSNFNAVLSHSVKWLYFHGPWYWYLSRDTWLSNASLLPVFFYGIDHFSLLDLEIIYFLKLKLIPQFLWKFLLLLSLMKFRWYCHGSLYMVWIVSDSRLFVMLHTFCFCS